VIPVRNRKILLTLFAVVLVDICGYTIVLPLLPFYAEHLGATPFVVGSIVSLFAVAQMISGPILGRMSDRYGRRPILIFSQVGTLLSFIILAQARTLWVVFLARIIDGLTAGNITVAQAYVADVTSRQDRTRAMGLIGAAFGVGFVLGPSLSAFFSGWSPQAPIWAACVISATAITGSILVLKESHTDRKPLAGAGAKPKLRMIDAFRDPNLRWPLCAFMAFTVGFSLLVSGLALYSERILTWHGKPFTQTEVGWVFTYGGLIGLTIQTLLIGRAANAVGEKKVAAIGFLSIALGFSLFGATPALWVFLVGYTLIQGGASFARPMLNGLISKSAPNNAQGFIFGVTQTLMALSQIIAPLMSGALIEARHESTWAWLSGAIALIGLVLINLAKPYEPEPQPIFR
jgi:DHA1 family tetracycline resistance protein-like MFS transporter